MLRYEFMRNAIVVSVLISVLAPSIGIFLVLRRFSMIGDTLAHASLAGVTLSLITHQNPVIGAFVFTAICGGFIELLRTRFRKNADLILPIILALSVGIAITIMSSGRLRVNADSFLFGSILTVTRTDMVLVAVLSVISVLTVICLYHRLIYIAYDEEAAAIAGMRVRMINYVFMVLAAAAVSVTIRIVGVLVISAMITLPVATALQFEGGFKITLILSVIFSIIYIMTGLLLSYYLAVAPGGFTALVSVAGIILVIAGKKIHAHTIRATQRFG